MIGRCCVARLLDQQNTQLHSLNAEELVGLSPILHRKSHGEVAEELATV